MMLEKKGYVKEKSKKTQNKNAAKLAQHCIEVLKNYIQYKYLKHWQLKTKKENHIKTGNMVSIWGKLVSCFGNQLRVSHEKLIYSVQDISKY